MSDQPVRLHVWVEGKVQGVFFRDTVRQGAVGLGLAGWVRNLPDGRVEAVFEGPREACAEALDTIRAGSPPSRVDNIELAWDEAVEELSGFEVRYP